MPLNSELALFNEFDTFLFWRLQFVTFISMTVLSCVSSQTATQDSLVLLKNERETRLEVVEIRNLKFEAESFFGERKNQSFLESSASEKYTDWAEEAIKPVNGLLPPEAILEHVKIKLIFEASIVSRGNTTRVPISMIESYQEPKSNSIRLGMHELKDDKKSFQLTLAHEYAHLVFENASRISGSTETQSEQIAFWSKPVYEGVADFVMSVSLNSDFTAHPNNWSARSLFEFDSLMSARSAKDRTVEKARSAFLAMGLIPKYPIYEDWLVRVESFILSLGGSDPYAEGRWLAGSLRIAAKNRAQQRKIISRILLNAKSGKPQNNAQVFQRELLGEMTVF